MESIASGTYSQLTGKNRGLRDIADGFIQSLNLCGLAMKNLHRITDFPTQGTSSNHS